MTQRAEQSAPCPRCGQWFPISQLHSHFNSCPGTSQHLSYPNQALPYAYPQQPPQQQPQQFYQPQYQQPMYIPPPKPEHKHLWFENATFKACLDPTCKKIDLKLRG